MAKKSIQKAIGRPCSICHHANAEKIDRDIFDHQPFRNISKRWLGSEKHYTAVFRHAVGHLKVDVQSLRSEARIERAVNVYEEFQKNLKFVTKVRDAAERWLTDPNNPEAFSIDPRADEVDVIYFDELDKDQLGNPKRKSDNLQEVLARLDGTRYDTNTQFIKTVDLRDFALKAIDKCDMAIDKFAKIGGAYTQDKKNTEDVSAIAKEVAARLIEKGWNETDAQNHAARIYSLPEISNAVN